MANIPNIPADHRFLCIQVYNEAYPALSMDYSGVTPQFPVYVPITEFNLGTPATNVRIIAPHADSTFEITGHISRL